MISEKINLNNCAFLQIIINNHKVNQNNNSRKMTKKNNLLTLELV